MQTDREMVILQSSGFSNVELVKPVFLFGTILTLLSFFFTIYQAPLSNKNFKILLYIDSVLLAIDSNLKLSLKNLRLLSENFNLNLLSMLNFSIKWARVRESPGSNKNPLLP